MSRGRIPDVAVVGAGIVGASIAYHLARAGAAVTLIDRAAPGAFPSATWASAGGLRSQGRHGPEQPLAREAAVRWRTLESELDADLDVRHGGHLHIAENEVEAAEVAARVAADRAAGLPIELLDGAGVRAVAPLLTPRANAGAFTPGDGQAHPARAARAFAAAAERSGVRLAFGRAVVLALDGGRVAGLTFSDGEQFAAGTVVVAAGAWSADLLAPVGVALPLRWRGLQMLLSDLAPPLLAPTVTAAGRNLSLKQLPSGQMMLGGRWHAEPEQGRIAARPVDALIARQWSGAVAILPAMARLRLAQAWAGPEAQSIDGMPFIGRAPIAGLYVATGFSGHGFQISPAVGAAVARDVAEGGEPLLAPFRLARAEHVDPTRVAGFVGEPVAV
jgi:sarcosine oxidase subunit beta